MSDHIVSAVHDITDGSYLAACRETLDATGALVLDGFFSPAAVETVLAQSLQAADLAFYTTSTHNVYLTDSDPSLGDDHVFNQQIVSTKGCITHNQVHDDSPLRDLYESPAFREFLAAILGVERLYPYADEVSSINVHFHHDGQELGWHFDNSEFAVTMLIQPPEAGGNFEYIGGLRDSDVGDMNFEGVAQALAGGIAPSRLDITPGALVLFRGRDAMHRITASKGSTTRVLVVFAYNTEPGIGLSASAKATFYGIAE